MERGFWIISNDIKLWGHLHGKEESTWSINLVAQRVYRWRDWSYCQPTGWIYRFYMGRFKPAR
jgi:hypothetical protein